MLSCQEIDLSDWKKICTEFWNIEVYVDDFGKHKTRVRKERNPLKNPQRRERVVIDVHQKDFGSGVFATVRSIYFFGGGPYIQLWRDCEHPLRGGDFDLDFFKARTGWWQNKFYRAVNLDGVWYRLEENEIIKFGKFIIQAQEKRVVGISLMVACIELPDDLVGETLIS